MVKGTQQDLLQHVCLKESIGYLQRMNVTCYKCSTVCICFNNVMQQLK